MNKTELNTVPTSADCVIWRICILGQHLVLRQVRTAVLMQFSQCGGKHYGGDRGSGGWEAYL